MTIPVDFRDKHDDTAEALHHIAGLAHALDDLLDGLPELTSATRDAHMIRSVLAALHREAQQAWDAHNAEWEAFKATQAEKRAEAPKQ